MTTEEKQRLINLNVVLKSIDGDDLKHYETKEPLTLRKAITDALLAPSIPEDNPSPTDKFERYQLAVEIANDDAANLTPDQITMICNLTDKVYPALVMAQVRILLKNPIS